LNALLVQGSPKAESAAAPAGALTEFALELSLDGASWNVFNDGDTSVFAIQTTSQVGWLAGKFFLDFFFANSYAERRERGTDGWFSFFCTASCTFCSNSAFSLA
jgi:hypothetical protein